MRRGDQLRASGGFGAAGDLFGLDGWLHHDAAAGELAFTRAPTPAQEEVEALFLDVHARVLRLLSQRGLLEVDTDDALARDAPALSAYYEGAVTQLRDAGPRPAADHQDQLSGPTAHHDGCVAACQTVAAERVPHPGE